MNLSQQTTQLLKNFSHINSNLIVKAGNQLRTISVTKETFVKATLPEEFERDFQIYDLNEFLGVMSMFDSPDIQFFNNYLTVSKGNAAVKYHYGDLDVFRPDPSKTDIYKLNVKMPTPEVQFVLTQNDLQALQRACNLLKLPSIVFEAKGDGKVCARVLDPNSPLSNNYSVELDCEHYNKFQFIYAVENLRLIPGEYKVSLSSHKISLFELQGVDGYVVEYYIAPHMDSTYDADSEAKEDDPPF